MDANSGPSNTQAPLVQESGEQGRMQADPAPSGHHRRTSSVFSDVSIADSDASTDQVQRKMLDSSFMRSLSSKALGLFGSSRAKTEDTIGEENKFYFDEKLGIWREEGKELPKEEGPPAPPPTFHPSPPGVQLSGGDFLPHGPPQGSGPSGGQWQRGNVRSRYVDTFAASQPIAQSQTGVFPGQGTGNTPPPGMFIPSTTVGSASSYETGTGSPFGQSMDPRLPVCLADPGKAGLFRSASTGHTTRGPYSGAISHAGNVPGYQNGSSLAPVQPSAQWETSNKGQNNDGHMHPTGPLPQPEHPASGMDRFSDIRL